MEARLDRVPRFKEVLPVNISDHYLLMAILHGIQPAIGILLKHREIGSVVLIAVGIQGSEDSKARFLVEKNKAPKIAVECLNPRASRNEVIGVTQVRELNFGESFLQSDMCIQPCGALAGVYVDDTCVLGREVVDIDFRSHFDLPVHRPESS